MRISFREVIVVLMLLLFMRTASATPLDFMDMDMKPENWNEISKFGTASESSSLIVNKQALQISTSTQLFVAVYKNDISWDPATRGSILAISASGTFLYTGAPVDFLPILVQGGNVYATPGVPPYLWEPPNGNIGYDHQWGQDLLPISVFGREIGTGPGTPDFSPGAPPIFFGFAGRRDAGGATFRFGNVAFSVVPEPNSLTLCAVMLMTGLIVIGSKRSNRNERCSTTPQAASALSDYCFARGRFIFGQRVESRSRKIPLEDSRHGETPVA